MDMEFKHNKLDGRNVAKIGQLINAVDVIEIYHISISKLAFNPMGYSGLRCPNMAA